jgi:hypothetical protein
MQQGCLDYERELFEHIERLDELSSSREVIATLQGSISRCGLATLLFMGAVELDDAPPSC